MRYELLAAGGRRFVRRVIRVNGQKQVEESQAPGAVAWFPVGAVGRLPVGVGDEG
ncbi:hypothetical protein ACQP1W_29355 [Spirillospora sp. CA-255316]